MEEKQVMSFRDEEGNKVDLEVIAKIYLEETEYLILAPEEGSEDDAFVFRVDYEEDSDSPEYNVVEDDEEFEAVKKEYKKLLYNKE